jgi:serine/threonine protein kinase
MSSGASPVVNLKRDIFCDALAVPAPKREAFLREACLGKTRLIEEVRSLLAAHGAADPEFLGTCAPALIDTGFVEPVPSEGPGTDVGRYRLLEKIGEGGFGAVYMAEQRRPVRRKVALKIIKLGMDTRQVVARFEAERQALALMDHPNIARVLDAGATETGRPYFVMELVRGTPITQYCDENRATTTERLELFIQVCSAIQHAHQKGIIHRDLKPSNVLVTLHDGRPVPKVIDFGIAKAMHGGLTDKTVFTRYHEFLGTPAYMSPEQAELTGLDIDTRSDIYSLGVLLYELLTGRTPFDVKEVLSGGYDALRRTIREVEPLKPSTRLNTLSHEDRSLVASRRRSDPRHISGHLRGDLDWIVMRALEKDRTRRYESASAFAQDIRRHLTNEPVSAVAPTVLYRVRKFARRHRAVIPLAAGITAILISATFFSTLLALRAIHAEATATSLLQTEQTARRQLQNLLTQLQNARQRADEEAGRARAEAATAAAVVRFLNEDLFAFADPEHEPRREVSLRTVIDRAAQALPASLSNQPLAEASIRTTIGGTYANLGQFEHAEYHLRRAHDLYARELGEDHRARLEVLVALCRALEKSEKLLPALPLAREAYDTARGALGTDDPVTLKALNRLAWCYYRLGQRTNALEAAQVAWITAQKISNTPEIDAFAAVYLLAHDHGIKGRKQEGEDLLVRVLNAHEARFGPNHVRTLRARNNLATFLYDHRRKLDLAERLYLDSLRGQLGVVGEHHEFTRMIRGNLALLYEVTGKKREALAQALAILAFQPERRGVAARASRLMDALAIPSLSDSLPTNSVRWCYTLTPPEQGWQDPGFDASHWVPELPSDAPHVWARCEFRLMQPPKGAVVLRCDGGGDLEAMVNGGTTLEFGAAGGGSRLAVAHAPLSQTLRVGRNVIAIAIRREQVPAGKPARCDVFMGPVPSEEP